MLQTIQMNNLELWIICHFCSRSKYSDIWVIFFYHGVMICWRKMKLFYFSPKDVRLVIEILVKSFKTLLRYFRRNSVDCVSQDYLIWIADLMSRNRRNRRQNYAPQFQKISYSADVSSCFSFLCLHG